MASQEIDSILAELDGPKAVLEQSEIQGSNVTESIVLNDADEVDNIDFSGLKKKKKGKRFVGRSDFLSKYPFQI